MISSKKNKDLWIEDYIKRVKVLSSQEIKLLETSWSSENNKVENYFRTDDGQGKLNLWLIDTYNYENLTVEMQVDLNVISKDAGCEIIIKPQKFKLYYLKMVIFFYIALMILFCIISLLVFLIPVFASSFWIYSSKVGNAIASPVHITKRSSRSALASTVSTFPSSFSRLRLFS